MKRRSSNSKYPNIKGSVDACSLIFRFYLRPLIYFTILLFVLFFQPIKSLTAATTPSKVKKVTVDYGTSDISEEDTKRMEALITVKAGDDFSEASLESIKTKIAETGLFSGISIEEKRAEDGGVIIEFLLTRAPLVRKVSIEDNYPYLSRRIMRLSALQEGSIFDLKFIPESEKRIEAFFEDEGYFGTKVKIKYELDRKYGAYNLHIDIDKGKTYHLGNVEVEGNQHYSDTQVANKLFSFFHFKPDRARNELKKLQDEYVKDGFVRARVKLEDYHLNKISNRIDVNVSVQERKRLILKFTGNRLIKDHTLKSYVTFFEERGYDRFSVERSLEKLIDFYRLNGFLQTSIHSSLERDEREVRVTFSIDEGPRTRLKKIIFEGNDSFDDDELEELMLTERHTLFHQGLFKEYLIPNDLNKIVEFYRQHGFFDAKIIAHDVALNEFGDQTIVTIHIEEGAPYIVNTVDWTGLELISNDEARKRSRIKIGKRYDGERISKTIERIESFYKEKGYAYFNINLNQDIDAEKHLVALTFEIEEGMPVEFGDIVIEGDFITKEDVIRDALTFKEGDTYRYKKVLDSLLILRRLGIFDYVRVEPIGLEEKASVLPVIIKLQERKTVTADIQAGYDSDKGPSGELVLTKRNIFGSAKQVQLRTVGGFELSRGEFTFYSPRVFGATWNLVNQYYVQYENDENFNATSYGASIGTLKHFGTDFSLLLKGQLERFNIFEGESSSEIRARNLFDSTFTQMSASAVYDTRNNYADPTRGLYALLNSELDTDLADISNNFNITNVNIAHYTGASRFTLVNIFRFGNIFKITDSARIPVTKLYFMGGNDTVRGFDEDDINRAGGSTSIIYNAELQFKLFDTLKLAGFFDTGSLTQNLNDISQDTFRESAGVGLRYITPVGPIRLDYGFVLDKRDGEDGRRIHFSFGYFF